VDRKRADAILDDIVDWLREGETEIDRSWAGGRHPAFMEGWDEHGMAHDCFLAPDESHEDSPDKVAKREDVNRRLDEIIRRLRGHALY
jgi:hypothetical protein